MNKWINGWASEWMNEQMIEEIDEWVNEWMNEQIDVWMKSSKIYHWVHTISPSASNACTSSTVGASPRNSSLLVEMTSIFSILATNTSHSSSTPVTVMKNKRFHTSGNDPGVGGGGCVGRCLHWTGRDTANKYHKYN